MNQFVIALLFACISSKVVAAPTKLKCQTADGETAADLVIDLSTMRMSWGISQYRIVSVTDRYVSAYVEIAEDRVGGEVFVFDRVSGSYRRAMVGMMMKSPTSPVSSARLSAATYEGKCATKIL